MRDSRIGAHGAVALVLALGLKWVALEPLLRSGDQRWLAAPLVARFVCTVLIACFSYARSDGLGRVFAGAVGPGAVLLAALPLVPLLIWLGPTLAPAAT